MSDEEDFGEMIIEGGDEDVVIDTPAKPDQAEIESRLTNDLISRFNPSSPAARRLINDFKAMSQTSPRELGFVCEPHGNDIFNWDVRVFGFEEETPIWQDLQQYRNETGRSWIDMAVSFPSDYPNIPPFVRVVQPRFAFHTGRVTVGGSLCTDVLTMNAWNPMYDIVSLMVNVVSEITNGNPRIDFRKMRPYSLQEAKAAFERVAKDHGWKTSGWTPSS
jgi:ubiquitin-conjugating enzyme E2 Q